MIVYRNSILLIIAIIILNISNAFASGLAFKKERSEHFAGQYMKLFNENKLDSVALVLALWERETGINEAVFRAYAIYLASTDKFPGTLLQYGLLEHAVSWEIRYSLIFENTKEDFFLTHPSFFSYLPIGSDFDQFTINYARRLINRTTEGSLARSFMTLYAGDTKEFFHALPKGEHSTTSLGYEFRERYDELIKMPETNLSVNVGGWMPHGPLAEIGLRPSVGVKVGRMYQRFLADIAFDVRFGDSSNDISIPLTDTIWIDVNNFIGARAALEVSYNLIKWQPNAINIFIGGGYEWIDMVKAWHDRRGKTFESPSACIGLSYRYFFPNRLNIGVSLAYNMLWFENPNGTPLSGNALTVALQISFLENPKKKIGLNRFGINYW